MIILPIPQDVRAPAEALLQAFCDRRVPESVWNEVRLEVAFRGDVATIYERRPPYLSSFILASRNEEWTRLSVAQFQRGSDRHLLGVGPRTSGTPGAGGSSTMVIPEPDWKTLGEVKATALDRFCRRVLDECRTVCDDDSASASERYRKLYDLIHERDKEIAGAFDDIRRSTAIMHLMTMAKHNLVTPEELARFSSETRRLLTSFDE